MINIDFLTIKAFLLENIDFLIGARLQKIQQPTRRDFILVLRNNGESRKLYININPQIYHIAFMSKENEEKRGIQIPPKPPMFCMLLRKYLEGTKIYDACVKDNERILELHFETYDELAEKRNLSLTTELMGKHSNVILYDNDTKIIIGCAHNIGDEKSRYRELKGGLKYVYPPSNHGFSNELKMQFEGLSQSKIDEYLHKEEFSPAIKDDRYTVFKELLPNSTPQNSINELVDNYYSNFQESFILNTEKKNLFEITNTKLKKISNTIEKISKNLQKRDNTEAYKLFGELLTANLYQKRDYSKNIEVYDYINNKNIIIDLDETKTLNENAQRYYKLYTKSKTAKEKTIELLNNLEIEKEYLNNVQYSIGSSNKIAELADIKEELGIVDKRNKVHTKPIVEKIFIDGFTVYIGKNNKQNDYIVSKLAKDCDYWFHTKSCAGSHILLKANNEEPEEKTLFECCKLARKYSAAKQPSKVSVIYTKAKNLRKPPASPLGYVTYKNEKEVLV